VTITPTTVITLGNALDNNSATWTTGGSANWRGQSQTTHDGVDAAQSAAITHSQESWVQTTTTTGAGNFSFWWKVSSESNFDYLEFYIDGVLQHSISGEVAWQQKTYSISSGSHTFKWRYYKDGSVSSGSDAGWVDQVIIPSGVVLPTVTVTATDSSATEGGDTATYRISRSGGSTTSALSVYYAMSGTATCGSSGDYTLSGGSASCSGATIPAGATYVDVILSALTDSLAESSETAIMTIAANSSYTVGSPSNATVNIVNVIRSARRATLP